MQRTRVKICGITRVEDGMAAASAGADAIGLIFHKPAPRNISIDRARDIIAALPPFVTPVGVFVDASAEEIIQTAGAVGLRVVQLNGHETPELARKISLAVIKAIRVDPDSIEDELGAWRLPFRNLCGVVLEPGKTGQPGGTGVANDWQTVRRLIDKGSFKAVPPLIAAGGLTPQTVGDVVRLIRPTAVDVSTGVEQNKGIKSRDKIAAFINAVRFADQ